MVRCFCYGINKTASTRQNKVKSATTMPFLKSEEVWETTLEAKQNLQFKVVHRLHYSKSMLHTIPTPNTTPLCDKCKHRLTLHQFWSLHLNIFPVFYTGPLNIIFDFMGTLIRSLNNAGIEPFLSVHHLYSRSQPFIQAAAQ